MKKFLTLLLVGVLAVSAPAFLTSCSTAPAGRVEAFKTLSVVGSTAKSGMDAATQLLKQGSITVAQWQQVATFYDTKFQPAFALAVSAANSDLSSPASTDITNLAIQFVALVAALYPPTK